MKKAENLRFRKWDLIAIAAVLLLGVMVFIAFLPQKTATNAMVQVYQDGKLIHEAPITRDTSYTVDGKYQNTVMIENGKVFIKESNCPGKDCVHSGRIDKPGRSIVCLPNRVEIRVTGQSEIDAVVR